MNDKDRDLVEQILKAAGTAGERGFAYLVHYAFIDGLVGMLGFACMLAVVAYLFHRLMCWKPQSNAIYDDEGSFARGLGIVSCAVTFLFLLIGFFTDMTEALAPEGAALNTILTHLK